VARSKIDDPGEYCDCEVETIMVDGGDATK
jgi:hypothetical protein